MRANQMRTARQIMNEAFHREYTIPFRVFDVWIGDPTPARDSFFSLLNMPGAE